MNCSTNDIGADSHHQAGFPFFQLDRYLKILVQDLNRHVAISEEFPRTAAQKVKSGGLLFERRVARIVTPGTLVDEKFMQTMENNFLLAIHVSNSFLRSQTDLTASMLGLAWMDLSTGEFYTQATNLGNVSSDLLRISPREIVLNQAMTDDVRQILLDALSTELFTVTQFSKPVQIKEVSDWSSRLERPVAVSEMMAFTRAEVDAGNLLLEYAKEQLLDLGMKLQQPVRRIESENMGIDKNTMRGLEIVDRSHTATSGGKGSLLHAIRRTVTKGGSRLLRERICSPSTSLQVIDQRLDLVEALVANSTLRSKLVDLLEKTFDSQRISQKFALGRGDADDLVSLHKTIIATNDIAQLAQSFCDIPDKKIRETTAKQFSRLSLDSTLKLAQNIAHAVDEDALLAHHLEEMKEDAEVMSKTRDILNAAENQEDADFVAERAKARGIRLLKTSQPRQQVAPLDDNGIKADTTDMENSDIDPLSSMTNNAAENATILGESWVMRRSASAMLGDLHSKLDALCYAKTELTKSLQVNAMASSLSLRWTPGLGHHVHVKGAKDIRNTIENLSSARSIGSSKSTRTFYVAEWSELGNQIDQIKLQIKAEEERVFQMLRESVITNLASLRGNAMVLDELDVACSFAILSSEQNFTRPILNHSRSHKIIDGQHPTVMLGLEEKGRSFVSNNCLVGEAERVWLITGPNMAGKSTFLRQNALISILAQVGCFVPAKYAELGIVDQIFSRIGSADNLYQDQSTFMIEMLETANILNKATPRSFVIMDEIGRGTTPEDGIAVGYACLHHLYNVSKCRTLFATHFHKLCDMTVSWPRLANYCTNVRDEADGSFSYVHRLRSGVNRDSHALKVAQLAGTYKLCSLCQQI